MFKKIIVASLSASAVLAFFALGMSGCSTNSTYYYPEFNSMTQAPVGASSQQKGNVSAFNMNNQGNQIMAKPSERIQASATYVYNCRNCKPDSYNQILVGLAGRSAQACIYDGGAHGDGVANFLLKAPAKQGTYDVRFRFAQANNCEEALKNWWNLGSLPAQDATIGKIIVR